VDNGKGVLYVCAGLVTGQELIDANGLIFSHDEQLKRLRYAVMDQTGIQSVDLVFDDLKSIEKANRQAATTNPDLVVAIVVHKTLPAALTRVWDLRTSDMPWEKKVFEGKEEAYAWLKGVVRERFGMEITCIH
jgi:hypothetical protein